MSHNPRRTAPRFSHYGPRNATVATMAATVVRTLRVRTALALRVRSSHPRAPDPSARGACGLLWPRQRHAGAHLPLVALLRVHRVQRAPPRYSSPHAPRADRARTPRSEEHTSELQSLRHLVCRLLLEK